MKKYAELSVGVYRMLNLNLTTYDCLDYETHAFFIKMELLHIKT